MKWSIGFFLLSTTLVFADTITEPIKIDLAYFLDGQRVGITARIGDAPDNGPYVFDTGSSPHTSAWATGARWWPDGTTAGTNPNHIIYGGGSGTQKFDYYEQSRTVYIHGANGIISGTMALKQVTSEYTNATPQISPANWVPDDAFHDAIVAAVHGTGPPPFANTFYGTMGANLQNTSEGFSSIVNSITYANGLHKGFIVNGSLAGPSVTVGLTEESIATFSNIYHMNVNESTGAIQESPLLADFTFVKDDTQHLTDIPTLLDTGTPPSSGVFLTTGTLLTLDERFIEDGYLKDGTRITITIGDTPYTLTSTANNPISVFTGTGLGSVTYGLNFFQNYEVMYDLDTKKIGIQAIPEPSTYALLALGALVLLIRRRVAC